MGERLAEMKKIVTLKDCNRETISIIGEPATGTIIACLQRTWRPGEILYLGHWKSSEHGITKGIPAKVLGPADPATVRRLKRQARVITDRAFGRGKWHFIHHD